jgi:hypothetical protein
MNQHETMRQLYRIADKVGDAWRSEGWDATSDAARIIRLGAKRLQRISESMCNGIERYDSKAGRVLASWTEADQASADKRRDKAEFEIAAAFAGLFGARVAVTFQNDPRGAPVRVWIDRAPSESASPDMHF